jgi:hypothetical protein
MSDKHTFTLLEITSALSLGLRLAQKITKKSFESAECLTSLAGIPVATEVAKHGILMGKSITAASLWSAEQLVNFANSHVAGTVKGHDDLGILQLLNEIVTHNSQITKVELDPLEKYNALKAYVALQAQLPGTELNLKEFQEKTVVQMDSMEDQINVQASEQVDDYNLLDVEIGTEKSEALSSSLSHMQRLKLYMNLCKRVYGPLFAVIDPFEPVEMPQDEISLKGEWEFFKPYHPTYWLVTHHATKSIVLVLRGTFSLHDILIDLYSKSVPFVAPWMDEARDEWKAHEGMLKTAMHIVSPSSPLLQHMTSLLEAHPDYELVFTGHSLGAGVATLVSLLLSNPTTGQTMSPLPLRKASCFAFGSAATLSPSLSQLVKKSNIETIVHDKDIVPSVSRGAILDVECMLVEMCRGKDNLLQAITNSSVYDPQEVYAKLKLGMKHWSTNLDLHEPLLVSGKVLWLRDGKVFQAYSNQVSEMIVSSESIHAHVPSAYEKSLEHF